MKTTHSNRWLGHGCFQGLWALLLTWCVAMAPAQAAENVYVLGDSIAYGLSLDGLETKLKTRLGGEVRINYDGARSITTPGNQVKKSALESVDLDKDFIASAQVVVLVLGMNQIEPNFAESQAQLLQKLKAVAPKARYFWVDIASTIAPQAASWSARNKTIYDNAVPLGYSVVSRYKAIFGPEADPLNIKPGQNFPNSPTEEGYGGPGNLHGFYSELSQALIDSITQPVKSVVRCSRKGALNSYILGDSISYGLHLDGLEAKLEAQLGGSALISYDVGRSITFPGVTIKKSALDSVDLDSAAIAKAQVIVIVLGTNQSEVSFADAQVELMQRLRALAPKAQYFWVDIGATIASQAQGWSERNRTIYANAEPLGYTVISRYKAIFGSAANPLKIVPGANFPGWITEPGYGAPGNVHGMQEALARTLLQALPKPFGNTPAAGC
ncbi:SGNH/GDSL hydrolase family protein [Rhodoferax aquaticus]|uniref:SGNH/GDSL hydrolase family protein n=1 Tax=Rhodoferax aquaticus TaxID=2527691 RepID=A0A515ERH6_9BURK|nr:SGNH/GDSL hydrolase family protein [Rhodoferax aquaticus]QDL55276.1 SGNH/GDSL hydrolase family protein [Rhodoferax aquaticus]